ncbi:hypothetical protein [Suttonella indologenes]|uniref:hypothetical protein n=1 Tax=Suttonella indologenes TaxID=13276 RepID=UPI0011C0249C|nr:hypothetical protein [Suttonella indologenes]
MTSHLNILKFLKNISAKACAESKARLAHHRPQHSRSAKDCIKNGAQVYHAAAKSAAFGKEKSATSALFTAYIVSSD